MNADQTNQARRTGRRRRGRPPKPAAVTLALQTFAFSAENGAVTQAGVTTFFDGRRGRMQCTGCGEIETCDGITEREFLTRAEIFRAEHAEHVREERRKGGAG